MSTTAAAGASGSGNHFSIQLKHKKCCVIQRTRDQISNFNERYDSDGNSLGQGATIIENLTLRLNRYWQFIKNNQCCITMILFILFMAWFCIMIGVLIGATACSNLKIISPLVHLKIPGLNWGTSAGGHGKCWKVF